MTKRTVKREAAVAADREAMLGQAMLAHEAKAQAHRDWWHRQELIRIIPDPKVRR